MSSVLKKTTRLTGILVDKNSRHNLLTTYGLIAKLLPKLPNDYVYRQQTEQLVMERAEIVKNTESIEEIEKKIDRGQIEELIIQAQRELKLLRNIIEWKSWEPIEKESPKDQWLWPPCT